MNPSANVLFADVTSQRLVSKLSTAFTSQALPQRVRSCQNPCRNKPEILWFHKANEMSHSTRRGFLATSASAVTAATFAKECLAQSATAFSTAAPEIFTGIVPASWALDVTRMSFLAPGLAPDAAKIGVQVVHGNAVWPYYPLRRDGGGLSDADKEILQTFVRDVQVNGMRLVLGLPPFPSVTGMKAHPEWRTIATASAVGAIIEPEENNLGTRLPCNLGPWGDYLIEICAELMEDYHLDGYSFDGNYHAALCHCNACKEAYRAEIGRDLPVAVNLDQIAYREYLVWRGEKLEDHYRKLQQRLKGIRPDAVIMTWTVNAGRYGHFLHSPRAMPSRLNLLIDLPMQEWWLDETNLGASIAPAFGAEYLAAVTGYRACGCEPYLMSRGNSYSSDSFPPHERMTRSLMVLAHGSTTAHSLGWTNGVEGAAPVFAETLRREPWITHAKPIPWVAILVSEQTRQFFAWRDIAERFLPHVFGSYRALLEDHLPVSLINDWDVTAEELSRYKAVILPNAAALSEAQVEALRSYVKNGGGLIATMETSLCDELGRQRNDFALADVFGVSYRGPVPAETTTEKASLDENFARSLPEEYWSQRAGAGTFSWDQHPLLKQETLTQLVPNKTARFKGPQVRVTAPTGPDELALQLLPDAPNGMSAPTEKLPAAIVRRYGKGRVVYFAAGVDAAMFSYAYPYQRMILNAAVNWAASDVPSVTVSAPRCVQAVFKERKDPALGRQLVLHLFNNVNTTAHHGAPATDVPLREETIPIHGIRVAFNGPAPRRLHLEPGNHPIEITTNAAGLSEVILPPLEIHAMLIGDDWS